MVYRNDEGADNHNDFLAFCVYNDFLRPVNEYLMLIDYMYVIVFYAN
jgi:hypothetical protein